MNNELIFDLKNENFYDDELKIETNVYDYNIKKSRNINQSKNLEFDKSIYFDIETASWNSDFHNISNLNITSLITITSFTFLIPISIFKKSNFNKYMEYLIEFKKLDGAVYNLQKFAEYYTFSYYSENKILTLDSYYHFFYYFSNIRKQNRFVGFNSNKFDVLILKHKNLKFEYQKYNNTLISNIKLDLPYSSNTPIKRVKFLDLIGVSKMFGGYNLKKLGQLIGLNKLDNDNFNSIDEFLKYNIRDVEILFEFTKMLNQKFDFFENNAASFSRKYYLKTIFDKYENIEAIKCDKKINKFDVYAARTEPYIHKIKNDENNEIKYIDVNSLYTSARVKLDMVDFEIKEDEIYYKLNNVNNKHKSILELKIRNLLSYFLTNNDFDYVKLNDLYNQNFSIFYMGFVKIKGFRDELTKQQIQRLKHYFPFTLKKYGRSNFQFFENEIYQITFYEFLFLSFFDFEIIEIYSIKKGNDILKDKLIEIYELRKKNKDLKLYYKLLLNIGFGIWITKNHKSEFIPDQNIQSKLLKLFDKENELMNKMYIKDKNQIYKIKQIGRDFYKLQINNQKWINKSIPILGLNIVSNARFFMYSFFLNDIFTSDKNLNIYYTDTDSFFCSEKFFEKIQNMGFIGNDLGQFKDEGEQDNYKVLECEFYAPKSYLYKKLNFDNDEIEIDKHFKGTGKELSKKVILQNYRKNFTIINKIAFNYLTAQKRTIKMNIFYNKISDEKYIPKWKSIIENIK